MAPSVTSLLEDLDTGHIEHEWENVPSVSASKPPGDSQVETKRYPPSRTGFRVQTISDRFINDS